MNEFVATRRRFATFARSVAATSPLYAMLAAECARDDDVVALAAVAPDDDGQAMLLLASVHRLLQDHDSPLRAFYPTLGGASPRGRRTWQEFRRFALDHADAIRNLVQTRIVQTNEVQRAAALYPALAYAARRNNGTLGIVEVGCSAGLLLHLDRYGYIYRRSAGGRNGASAELRAGRSESPLQLVCDVSDLPLVAALDEVTIDARVGLDRRPIGLRTADEIAWLEACIWADQPERLRQLRHALEAVDREATTMIQGDAVDDLGTALAAVPTASVVVLTSWVLTYLSPAQRVRLVAMLHKAGADRDVLWIANETFESCLIHLAPDRTDLQFTRSHRCVLSLVEFTSTDRKVHIMGTTDVFGRSVRDAVWPA